MAIHKLLTFTPVLDTSAYAAGDVLAVATVLNSVMTDDGGCALLESLTVIDKANNKIAIDMLIFDSAPASSVGAINAALAVTDADMLKLVARHTIAAADYVTAGANAEACYGNIRKMLKSAARSRSLYIVLVVRSGTPTFAASDLVFKLGIQSE